MSDVTKTVVVSKEMDAVAGALVDLVLSASAGKLDLMQELSVLVSNLGNLAALPAEIRGNQVDSAEAVALQLVRLISGMLKLPAGS